MFTSKFSPDHGWRLAVVSVVEGGRLDRTNADRVTLRVEGDAVSEAGSLTLGKQSVLYQWSAASQDGIQGR